MTSGRASGPKCSYQNYSPLKGTLQAPRHWGEMEVKLSNQGIIFPFDHNLSSENVLLILEILLFKSSESNSLL